MASLCAVAVLLAAVLSTAGAEAAASSTACDALYHASMVSLHCPGFASASPARDCCAVLLAGGVPCLCMAAETPRIMASGIRVEDLINWYRTCSGDPMEAAGGVYASCSFRSLPPPPPRARGWTGNQEETRLVAAVTTPVQPQYQPVSVDQWPWYGYVVLVAVCGAFLFAGIALCGAGPFCSMVLWLVDTVMGFGMRAKQAREAGLQLPPVEAPRLPPVEAPRLLPRLGL